MNCDVCKTSLIDRDGYDIVGKKISLLGAHSAREEVEILFGKNVFNICHICLLKSLGVKPIKKSTKAG